eukprot:TRINITY_DN5523_c0_g1_i1.p2 TRINITY_DN5523_c0_g1~~TRINITY_DN5523_c0_g1_i1.p2  ORF type:complete len:100 (-),score=28.28 TRINITY_DN5523_c0_g1_i1:53-352(-)
MATKTPIAAKHLADLKEQLDRMNRDRDRVRLVTASAEGHWFTCAQVKELVEVQHFGEAKTMTAVLLYPKVIDPDNFEATVISAYQFEEDKKEVKAAIGL